MRRRVLAPRKSIARKGNAKRAARQTHSYGYYMTVTRKDGFKLDSPYKADVLNIAPGERYDVIIEANEPGVWALHCHILTHAKSPHGMFGMASALIVNGM